METVLANVEICTMWINESFLAPFFLNHYSFANHIRIIDDEETTDNTAEIVSKYPNASIEYIRFPDKFDNDIAVRKLNQCYAESKADWFIAVDTDEFVLTDNLPAFLGAATEDIFFVRLYQVYRNVNDSDLDSTKPIIEQRRHGWARAVRGQNRAGAKPIVVRTGLRRLKWQPGQHNIWNRYKYVTSETVLLGAHWVFADPDIAVSRRLRGRDRQSKQNILRGNSVHYNVVNEEQIRTELEQHKNDPRLF